MTLNVGTGGVVGEAAEILVGVGGGVAAPVQEGWVGTGGGAMQRFYTRGPALSAEVTPDYIGWAVVIPYSLFESSSDAAVIVSGGTPPYTYQWATSTGSATALYDTASATRFQSSDGLPAEAWCVVTDADERSVETNHVSLT